MQKQLSKGVQYKQQEHRTKLSDDSTCPPGHILIVVSTHGHGTALRILHAFTLLSPRPFHILFRFSSPSRLAQSPT